MEETPERRLRARRLQLHLRRSRYRPADGELAQSSDERSGVLRWLSATAYPDNTKTGVTRARICEPDLNPTYRNSPSTIERFDGVLGGRTLVPPEQSLTGSRTMHSWDTSVEVG